MEKSGNDYSLARVRLQPTSVGDDRNYNCFNRNLHWLRGSVPNERYHNVAMQFKISNQPTNKLYYLSQRQEASLSHRCKCKWYITAIEFIPISKLWVQHVNTQFIINLLTCADFRFRRRRTNCHSLKGRYDRWQCSGCKYHGEILENMAGETRFNNVVFRNFNPAGVGESIWIIDWVSICNSAKVTDFNAEVSRAIPLSQRMLFRRDTWGLDDWKYHTSLLLSTKSIRHSHGQRHPKPTQSPSLPNVYGI